MALAVGVVIALSRFIGPLAAGFVGLLIFAVIGGGCAWYGYQRLVRDLSRDTPEIAAARIEAERRRARLMATAQELQDRLSPKTLAKGAWQGAKEKGADLAEDAVDAVKARPLAATGVVAAITMFLAREPLMDLAGSIVQRRQRETKEAQDPQDVRAKE